MFLSNTCWIWSERPLSACAVPRLRRRANCSDSSDRQTSKELVRVQLIEYRHTEELSLPTRQIRQNSEGDSRMRDAVIVNALRTAIGKAPRNAEGPGPMTWPQRSLNSSPSAPQIKPEDVEDVIGGCATPEAQQGANMARQIALLGGLPVTTSALTINRFCSSGLQI